MVSVKNYNLRLINTYCLLIPGQFTYVYGIFFARTFIMDILDSLREAAKVDVGHVLPLAGCGEHRRRAGLLPPARHPGSGLVAASARHV